MEALNILNAYCGLGGNRLLWNEVHPRLNITAVEKNEDIAKFYSDTFPGDKVIVGDAHSFIEENFHEYDFIWTSPPCQSHSIMNTTLVSRGQKKPCYQDMRLWQEIRFLKQWFKGGYCVENVVPLGGYMIPAKIIERHSFWCSFNPGNFRLDEKSPTIEDGTLAEFSEAFGIDITGYKFKGLRREQLIRNCVNPLIGKHIFERFLGIEKSKKTKQLTIKI